MLPETGFFSCPNALLRERFACFVRLAFDDQGKNRDFLKELKG